MIEKLFGKITKFYQFSFILLVCVTLGTVFYFWQLGFIDGSKIQNLHKAGFVLETYSKENSLKEILNLVVEESPKKAIETINRVENELDTINELVSVEEYDEVKDLAKSLKSEANNLITFTKSEKVILVFTGKLSKFFQFVKQNQWRTLTRMSERIYTRVSGHLNKDKIEELSFGVLRDFDAMIKITENSILSRADKADVISRLDNLKTEMIMLSKFAKARKVFESRFARFENSVQLWLTKVSPEITMGKIENQQLGKTYIFAMLGIVALITALFFVSFFFNKIFMKKAKLDLEKEIETYLSEGILERNSDTYKNGSYDFKEFSHNMSSYIAKRMSYGSIFQESLPFASLLLDQNLKVVWANSQFCEDWEVSSEEIKKEYMSWDYLNKFTNIGSDDPVLEALKNNIAGIYQIQMKPNEKIDARAYEMFVSPVIDHGETKIMLYFYDLTNLQDTISDQSKSILNPVKKSVDLIIAGDFVASEQMEYEFKIAGIAEVYEKFMSLNENIYYSENELLAKLRSKEFELNRMTDLLEDVYQKNSMNAFEVTKIKSALKNFKNNVIGLSELSKEVAAVLDRSKELVYTNIAALKASSSKVMSLKNMTLEMAETLPNFDTVKSEMKMTKKSLSEHKIKLASEITQLKKLVDSKGDERMQAQLTKLASAFENLLETNDELEKKVSSIEIGLSKAQMVINSSKDKIIQTNDEYEQSQVQYSQSELARVSKIKPMNQIEAIEAEIVHSLGELYQAGQNLGEIASEIAETNIALVSSEEPFAYRNGSVSTAQI